MTAAIATPASSFASFRSESGSNESSALLEHIRGAFLLPTLRPDFPLNSMLNRYHGRLHHLPVHSQSGWEAVTLGFGAETPPLLFTMVRNPVGWAISAVEVNCEVYHK